MADECHPAQQSCTAERTPLDLDQMRAPAVNAPGARANCARSTDTAMRRGWTTRTRPRRQEHPNVACCELMPMQCCDVAGSGLNW